MKKIILIAIFLTGILFPTQASASEVPYKQVRDSIFREAASQPNDSLRSAYLRKAFQSYIGQEQGTEYLDSALVLSTRRNMNQEELWTLFDYCRHYEYCADYENMKRYFLKLKEASYKYKVYDRYYTVWLAMLQAKCAQGDMEYAILQAKDMQKEAAQLKYKNGLFVSYLALGQAYDFAQKDKEAIEAYQMALKVNPKANDNARVFIHRSLSALYKKQKHYPQAISELQLQLEATQRLINGSPLSKTDKTVLLGIEIAFGQIYMEANDIEKMKQHLKKAGDYYGDNIYYGSYADYHYLWGCYYKITKEWKKCFQELNLALAACRDNSPFYENEILKTKAAALRQAGNYEEAAKTYRTSVIKGDSLNQDMLQRHEEAYQANFKIQNALLKKERLKKEYLYMQVGAVAIILVSLILVLIHAARVRRQLHSSEKKTRLAYKTMQAADKMKERFLHNITYEIRIPLNTVVGFSELLSSEQELTDEEIQEYSAAIKNNSAKLLALINNILDLSRLEAGMMRFTVQECDVVELCREAKMMTEMQYPEMIKLTFNTDMETLQIQADSRWFLKMLTTLFAAPKENTKKVHNVEYTLSKGGQYLTIVIKGSPLYLCWEDEQEQRILHDINRLYIETFKGTYQILGKEEDKLIAITYPIS